MALGGFRLVTMFDSTRRPGCSPIISTRQGVLIGAVRLTATAGSSTEGASFAARVRASRCEWIKYMPA